MGLPGIRLGTATGFGQGIPPPCVPGRRVSPHPETTPLEASATQHPLAARAVEGRGVAGDAGGRGARDMSAITAAMRTQMAEVQQGCGV